MRHAMAATAALNATAQKAAHSARMRGTPAVPADLVRFGDDAAGRRIRLADSYFSVGQVRLPGRALLKESINDRYHGRCKRWR